MENYRYYNFHIKFLFKNNDTHFPITDILSERECFCPLQISVMLTNHFHLQSQLVSTMYDYGL